MPRITPLRYGLAVPAFLMTANLAYADLTTAEVWADWQSYMQSMGYQVTAEESADGDDLVLNTIKITLPAMEGAGEVTLATGPLTFVQSGADVDIVMQGSMPIVLDAPAVAGGDPWKMSFAFNQTGHALKITGTPGQKAYDYSAEAFGLVLQELVTDGETYGAENAKINISGTNMRTATNLTKGEVRQYDQTGTLAALDYDIFMHNPVEDVKLALKGGTTDLTFDGTSSIPTGVNDAGNMSAMLQAGFAVVGGLDLSGQMKMIADVFDPQIAATLDAPAEIEALNINSIVVDAVGAKLDGSGAFTFDNTDTTTYGGMPKPVGAVSVALAGGNALLDKLVAMGLLPEQQAMGARMMMGLFAVPGDAPDTLKSKVEFNEAGQILANGQRIK